jgi:uncharacterized protein YggL (DUF469 family)
LGDVGNVVELHEGYKFVNMSGSWFGLVCKLQAPKVGHTKTGGSLEDLEKILSVEAAPLADLWATFEHVLVSFIRWSY